MTEFVTLQALIYDRIRETAAAFGYRQDNAGRWVRRVLVGSLSEEQRRVPFPVKPLPKHTTPVWAAKDGAISGPGHPEFLPVTRREVAVYA